MDTAGGVEVVFVVVIIDDSSSRRGWWCSELGWEDLNIMHHCRAIEVVGQAASRHVKQQISNFDPFQLPGKCQLPEVPVAASMLTNECRYRHRTDLRQERATYEGEKSIEKSAHPWAEALKRGNGAAST